MVVDLHINGGKMEFNFNETIKEIKSIDDLKTVAESYGVVFKREGENIKGCCPIHKEKTPSFSITDKGEGAFFHCFGCGAGGDVVNLVQAVENLPTLEALRKAYEILGKKLNINPSKIDNFINFIEKNNNIIEKDGVPHKYED